MCSVLFTACSHIKKDSPSFTQRHPSATAGSFSKYLQVDRPHPIIFFGTDTEFNEFVQKLRSEGFKIRENAMAGEIVANGIDDNGDGFIDNGLGWNAAKNIPFEPAFAFKFKRGALLHATPTLGSEWVVVYPIILPADRVLTDISAFFPIIGKLDQTGSTPIVVINSSLGEVIISELNSRPPLNQYGQPIPLSVLTYW